MRATKLNAVLLLSMLAGASFCESAQAQGVGVGAGIYGRPRPYPAYPYFGVFPFDYPGFYGNGMSMYGPPVPTYGPIPGTFGASDYRVNQNAPWLGFPGIYATWSPSRPLLGRNREPGMLDGEAIRGAVDNDVLMVEVHVPLDNVIVFINDKLTKQNGVVRYFASPPLKAEERFQYTVRAVWTIDGRRNDKSIVVEGKPGDRVVADFIK